MPSSLGEFRKNVAKRTIHCAKAKTGVGCILFVIGFGILWWNPVLARVSINPQLYDLSFSKALLAFHEGQYEATAFLRDALEAKPGDPDASYYLGQALIRAQHYQEAEEIYRRLTDAEPSSGRARVGLAMAQYYQERYQDVLSNLMTARTQVPSDPLAYYLEEIGRASCRERV